MARTHTINEDTFQLELRGQPKNEQVIVTIGKELIKQDVRQIVDIYGKNLIAAIINKMLLFIEDYNTSTQSAIASAVATRHKLQSAKKEQIKGGKKIRKEVTIDTIHIEPKGIPIWTYGYISQLFGGFFKESISGNRGSELYSQMTSLSPHGIRTAEHRPPYFSGTTGMGESSANAFIQMQDTGWGNMMRLGFHFPTGSKMKLKNEYGNHIEMYGWRAITSPYNINQVLREMWNDIESCSLYSLFQREVVDKLIASGRFKQQPKEYIE